VDKGVSVETTVKITIESPLRGSFACFGSIDEPLLDKKTIIVLSMEDAKALAKLISHKPLAVVELE
jgi:hypothetical protein